MKTESVMVQNLCVPCACRCRYCLLSWDGRPVGVPWDRGEAFARRFLAEARASAPDVRYSYSFGYSMEHPKLREALCFLREIGSPQARFLQCDGMRMRSEDECADLAALLAEAGVEALNFTFYGRRDYHDRFAGRHGDFDLLLRMLAASVQAGLTVYAGMPLTRENAPQAAALAQLLREGGCASIRLFIPHEEGRGAALAAVRLSEEDLMQLPQETRRLLNPGVYRAERDWYADRDAPAETRRAILISLRADTIERYERMHAQTLIREIETLDEQYYAAFPDFRELAGRYGDPAGTKLYSKRDLAAQYRKQFLREYGMRLYDVTDERQSGSRRY